jgi:plasmid stabilization system protein ParE
LGFDIRYVKSAKDDLNCLFDAAVALDLNTAKRAMDAIDRSLIVLEQFPFACRKVESDNPFLRELVIDFGNSGYVALFEIIDRHEVVVLAVRHQREDDYH